MEANLINEKLGTRLTEFVTAIKDLCGDNLVSAVLYGGAARRDHTEGRSNTNVLLVFETVNLDVLDQLSLHIQKAMADFKLSPFILTSSEIVPSAGVFAVKLFDIQQHHFLLYGADLLKGLSFDKSHLRFICEQELRNHLSRMKYFYIHNANLHENLLDRVQKGITSLLVNGNTFLYLKRGRYYATRREVMEQLLAEPEMDREILGRLVSIRQESAQLSPALIRDAYDGLMIQYKQLIKAINQLHAHG